jgi:MscS family membrane protein
MPVADRRALGTRLATKLDIVLRKLQIDLASIPDSWNAPPQVLGRHEGLSVELVRQRDGTWRFSGATVAQIPQLIEKLAAQEKADRSRSGHLESARDTMVFFLNAVNHDEDERAARCLDLDGVHTSARDALGPVLAVKLKYVIDRIGRVYPQEIPDDPEGPRYVFSSSELARIVIARKTDGPSKGKWLFTEETVEQIEPMFLAVIGQPIDESLRSATFHMRKPTAWQTPGIWLRLHLPPWARVSAGRLELYQWIGLGVTLLVSWITALVGLTGLRGGMCWLLRKSGSVLSVKFVACRLRPLTFVATCWLFFKLPEWLDLPVSWLNSIMPARTFLMAGLVGWMGLRVIDLIMAIYMNSELLRPHRNLSDMIVPVCQRLLKGLVFLMVATYVIYHVGRGESLMRFFTGLGAAGLAASLAAQDILKSFFGTLLLIGERSFTLGDRIRVDGKEGTVEQVGFRSTRLRTPDGSVLMIPNSTLASTSIDNQGIPTGKCHSVSVSLGKEIPVEQIASLRDRLQTWLRDHPAVHADDVDVAVNLHRDTGVELQVNFVLQNTPEADEATARQEITYAVLRMVQAVQKPVTLSTYRAEVQRAG